MQRLFIYYVLCVFYNKVYITICYNNNFLCVSIHTLHMNCMYGGKAMSQHIQYRCFMIKSICVAVICLSTHTFYTELQVCIKCNVSLFASSCAIYMLL